MKITFRYLRRNHTDVETLELSPSDYMDPLDPGDTFEANGIPRFAHARLYLPQDLAVAWTEVSVARASGVTRIFEWFADNDAVEHWQRTDPDGDEELCISSRLDSSSWHIVRLRRTRTSQWRQAFNSVVHDHADGSQSETVLFRGERP